MFSTTVIYEVLSYSVGDTKAGTKMGKLQLKNTEDSTNLNCILLMVLGFEVKILKEI